MTPSSPSVDGSLRATRGSDAGRAAAVGLDDRADPDRSLDGLDRRAVRARRSTTRRSDRPMGRSPVGVSVSNQARACHAGSPGFDAATTDQSRTRTPPSMRAIARSCSAPRTKPTTVSRILHDRVVAGGTGQHDVATRGCDGWTRRAGRSTGGRHGAGDALQGFARRYVGAGRPETPIATRPTATPSIARIGSAPRRLGRSTRVIANVAGPSCGRWSRSRGDHSSGSGEPSDPSGASRRRPFMAPPMTGRRRRLPFAAGSTSPGRHAGDACPRRCRWLGSRSRAVVAGCSAVSTSRRRRTTVRRLRSPGRRGPPRGRCGPVRSGSSTRSRRGSAGRPSDRRARACPSGS